MNARKWDCRGPPQRLPTRPTESETLEWDPDIHYNKPSWWFRHIVMFTIHWPRVDAGSLLSRTLSKRSVSTHPAPPQEENRNILHSVPCPVLAPTVRPGRETAINDSYCQGPYSLATKSSEKLCLLILLPIGTICWGFAMHLMQCIFYLIFTRPSEICIIISI